MSVEYMSDRGATRAKKTFCIDIYLLYFYCEKKRKKEKKERLWAVFRTEMDIQHNFTLNY